MKSIKVRFFCMTVGWALFCAILSACGGSPAPVSVQPPAGEIDAPMLVPVSAQSTGPEDELDAAIRAASDYLNTQLPKGNKLVILNVQSEFPALSEYIIDELVANTVNDQVFTVVDRQQLNTIRAELTFQASGEVDEDTAQALGRMAGTQTIISGAVSRIGDLYRLRVRALSVQSAQIEGQFNRNIPDGPIVSALVESDATGYNRGTAAAKPGTTSAPVVTPAPAPGSGWLGVSLTDPDREMMQALKIEGKRGALATQVFLGSPADKGGIRPGDFITHINGKEARGMNPLTMMVGDLKPGEQVPFTVIRDGVSQNFQVRIEARTDTVAADNKKLWPGLFIVPLTDAIRDSLNLDRNAQGLYVAQVMPETPAAIIGLQRGDRITGINGETVRDLTAFYKSLREKTDRELWFNFIRGDAALVTR